MDDKKDRVFARPMKQVSDFVFDRTVVQAFDDMINRSIPGYETVVHQIGAFAKRYARAGTNIYDLGCALGAATFAVRHSVALDKCHIVAVDNSSQMIEQLEKRLGRDVGVIPVTCRCEDILDTPMENASFTVLNFTLQFIEFEKKQELISKIFDSLVDGGVLVLSEKIVYESPQIQEEVESLYYDFKRHNGYNDLEISQKRDALENVLRLETTARHVERLSSTGFKGVFEWYRALNFASFIAVK